MKKNTCIPLTADNTVEDIDNDKTTKTPEELAEFLGTHREQIVSILCHYGSLYDAEEAVGELACKILGAKNGYGSKLKFLGDPFNTPRSQGGWIGWILWQARRRLQAIQQHDKLWHFNNAINSTATHEDLVEHGESVDCELSPMESFFVGGVNRDDVNRGDVNRGGVNRGRVNRGDVNRGGVNRDDVNRDDVNRDDVNRDDVNRGDGPGDSGEDAEISPDGNSRDARRFGGYAKWLEEEEMKNRRILSFVAAEEDRQLHNYIPRPGDDLDDAIDNEAAPATFEQVCKEYNVSKRDADVFYRTRIERENCEEVARDYKITANNVFQIGHRVGTLMKTFGPEVFSAIRARNFGRL